MRKSHKAAGIKTVTEETNKAGPALEDALIAIQKAFSRVNQKTADRNREAPDSPLAHIIGTVDATFKTTGRVVEDRFMIDSSGDVEIAFSGTIDTDIEEGAKITEAPEPMVVDLADDISNMSPDQLNGLDLKTKIDTLRAFIDRTALSEDSVEIINKAFSTVLSDSQQAGKK